ncbi:TVP38/TMEM64 family inner membrane protein YdjZ [Acaryochloris thomasi RCC1774]|uniref:TVP38/TMEM64 family membrane protein n=1 Tax=Acaryochloris thomasi RCC1774 TaxID=1764569 RepID=A0A2W1JE67_9CYAN|nr:TVP38/TMEM64 family protein [Acaryochloris thomasi]PZD72093.1 TVP38/TMEM64 family inner membrane protein YdjZ [Acaryochloris thomasi RCC1774]
MQQSLSRVKRHVPRPALLALASLLCVLALPKLLEFIPLLFNQMRLLEELRQSGFWAVVIFILLHIGATMIGIPGVVLTLVGGVAFGLVWGSLWSLIGATLGAIAAFWMARSLLHGWAQRRIRDQKLLTVFNDAIQKHPFAFVLTVRFAPISPFNLVNFLFGLTEVHWMPYSLGTLIGIIPGVMAYTWVGVTGHQAMQGENLSSFIIACSLLALMSAFPLLMRKRRYP